MKIRPGTMRYDKFVKKRQIELHLIFFSWNIHDSAVADTPHFSATRNSLVKQRNHELKYNHS